MLHITNGDNAVAVLRQVVAGEFLPWRDVLHEGPVDAALPLAALSAQRAAFIAGAFSLAQSEVLHSFQMRDAALSRAHEHDEVVLWFEHDLYDQLQLLQLLDWFAVHPHARLTLVCEAEYLGTMAPARAAALFRDRKSVSRATCEAASAAWRAVGGDDPTQIGTAPVAGLPFLAPALERLLEELPWSGDGLSRLERQALQALAGGPLEFAQLFRRAHHEREAAVFLGDTVLAWRLALLEADGLARQAPLWTLTDEGREVLAFRRDAWASPRRPRWLGGYEIRDARLRWDPAARSPRATGSTGAAPRR